MASNPAVIATGSAGAASALVTFVNYLIAAVPPTKVEAAEITLVTVFVGVLWHFLSEFADWQFWQK